MLWQPDAFHAEKDMKWIDEVYEDRRFGALGKTVFARQSAFQNIQIVETAALGRALLLDGMWMTAERDERIYHEMLAQPALTTAKKIQDVLVIGGGDGGTVREVLRHAEVRRCVMVEIDGDVVDVCQQHLPTIGTAWDDPRLDVQIGDGAVFVDSCEAAEFDVILVDGADPIGPAAVLFSAVFFGGCKRILRPGGVICAQGGSPTVQAAEHVGAIRAMGQHFRAVAPLYAPVGIYPGGAWSFIWASDSTADPRSPQTDRVSAIVDGCAWYNAEVHAGAFAVPNSVRAALRSDS